MISLAGFVRAYLLRLVGYSEAFLPLGWCLSCTELCPSSGVMAAQLLCGVMCLQIRVPGAHTERWRTEQTPHSCGCKAGLRRPCWALSPVSPLRSRWKWNRTCWMTRCVTSARARAAVGSLPPSSVPMSPVYSTTVNTAGPASTPEPAASSTNRWWRREATALGTSRSAGAERQPGRPSYKYWSRITRRKRGHCLRAHGVLEICAFVLDF